MDGPKDPWPLVLSLPGRFVGDPASLARDNILAINPHMHRLSPCGLIHIQDLGNSGISNISNKIFLDSDNSDISDNSNISEHLNLENWNCQKYRKCRNYRKIGNIRNARISENGKYRNCPNYRQLNILISQIPDNALWTKT